MIYDHAPPSLGAWFFVGDVVVLQISASRRLASFGCFAAAAALIYLALSNTIITTQLGGLETILGELYTYDVYAESAGDEASQEGYERQSENVFFAVNGAAQAIVQQDVETLPAFQPNSYNVTEGVQALWRINDYAPAVLIAIFSIIIPVIKTLFSMALTLMRRISTDVVGWLHVLNKYALVDVFVVSVTAFALSQQKFFDVELGISVVYYILYVAVSYLGLRLLKPGGATEPVF